MNKVSDITLNFSPDILNDTPSFQSILSDLEENTFSKEEELIENEVVISEEEFTEMILQSTVANNIVKMMKEHENAMEELLDE
ncbi:hypothetical protein U3C50_001548 [Providencia rettgeri]|nr:hypothetical protein [Providencia rettgeri]